MTVSSDHSQALVGWYRILNTANPPYTRLKLTGLDPDRLYTVREGKRILGDFYGDELMNVGLITSQKVKDTNVGFDFESKIYILQ